MALKVHAPEVYQDSIRKLFPRGSYWDKQFEDAKSDCSLFCKAKAGLIVSLRKRMADLQRESVMQTAEETLGEWERALLGTVNSNLDTARRRALLSASSEGNINVVAVKDIGKMYGVTITGAEFPFRPAFFCHSRFGIDPVAGPAAFSVLFVYSSLPSEDVRADFEKSLVSKVLSNYIVYFIYGGS